jgi:hypothetical protein
MIAVVTWEDSEHRAVEVQVGAHRSTGNEWSNRHLTFTETDAEIERWRAVGLVIATLAGEVSAAVAEPTPPPPRVAPSASAAKAAPPVLVAPAQRPTPAWSLGAEVELARGSSTSFGAYGLSVRVTRRLLPRFLFGTASVHYDTETVSAEHLNLSFAELTLGLGASLPVAGSRIALEPRLEPELTFVRANLANQAASNGAQSGTLWALREGLGAVWWWSEWFGVSASGDLYQSNRRTVVHSQQGAESPRTVAEIAPLGWSAALGIRVGFDPH